MEEIKQLQNELHLMMNQEDLKGKQMAKRYWYMNNDQNTKYFHACANQRRQKNFIKQVVDDQNWLQVKAKTVEVALRNFFVNLITMKTPSMEDISLISNII